MHSLRRVWISHEQSRTRYRLGRAHRLGVVPAFPRARGSTSWASTTTCGRIFSATGASTQSQRTKLERTLPNYTHHARGHPRRERRWRRCLRSMAPTIKAVIHTAAQPSHDWAAREPFTDFGVNATGTLNVLEAARQHLSRGGVHFHQHQQGLWRHAKPTAAASSSRSAGRSTQSHPFHSRHRRDDVDRSDRSIRSSVRARWRRTCWCRNTGGTSACRRSVFAAAA